MRNCLILVFLLCTACAQRQTGTNEWQRLFLNDLSAAKAIIRHNHPGSFDSANPGFSRWVEDGYQTALEFTPLINTAREYRFALSAYGAGFRDSHLMIAPSMQNGRMVGFEDEAPVRRWPGFLTSWQDGEYVIAHTAGPEQMLQGGKVISCDQLDINTITEARVFTFNSNPDLPAHWVAAVARTFLDRGNTLAPLPRTCKILTTDGKMKEHHLHWRDYNAEELREPYSQLGFGTADKAGFQWLAEGFLWVSTPHFSPGGEAVAAYQDILKEIKQNRERIHNLVFDLRGNTGGSSYWGNAMVRSLWGTELSQAIEQAYQNGYVEWRVTANNIRKIHDWLAQEKTDNPSNTEGISWAKKVITGMTEALHQEHTFWRENEPTEAKPLSQSVINSLSTGPRVFALTDGYCGSACLDFMDLLMIVPSVTHIGHETSADTQYMDITALPLPSGLMSVIYPAKVYRGRQRPKGGYYVPKIRYTGVWETQQLQNWVLRLIEDEE